jgi:hypothetical protein
VEFNTLQTMLIMTTERSRTSSTMLKDVSDRRAVEFKTLPVTLAPRLTTLIIINAPD